MKSLVKIVKYAFYDTLRSYWALLYGLFFLVTGSTLLYFAGDFSKAMVSLLNVMLFIVPLVSTVFGVMYYYNSREFVELLLAQPMRRRSVFMGQYLGLTSSLALSYAAGLVLSFFIYQGTVAEVASLGLLLICGVLLTAIFTGVAFLVSASHEDRIKGFGIAILLWLYAAVLYDGLFLAVLVVFDDYPLEKVSLVMAMLNPIDLTRILVLLRLETAALLGYTGAVFNQFFGTLTGLAVSFAGLAAWVLIPLGLFIRKTNHKDF
jgi:Cu-processing system permease protein